MVALVWALIQAILSLFWLVVESALGWHEQGVVHAQEIMWGILPPVAVTGALVHNKIRIAGSLGYAGAVKIGLLTALYTALFTTMIWGVYTNFIDTELVANVAKAASLKAGKLGMSASDVAIVESSTFVVLGVPTFLLIAILGAVLTGVPTTLLGSAVFRKRQDTA